MVEHLKVLNSRACLRILISRAPCRVRVYLLGAPSQISNQRATKVPLQFTYWVGGLMVEPPKGSSSIYLFAPQISQKMVEHLKVRVYLLPLSNK